MNVRAILAGLAALLSTVLVAGCGNKQAAHVSTQVAARVNAEELTVHQINYVLARGRDLTPESAPTAKRAALEGLIAQQLAIQQSIKAGLDRSPRVLQDLEAAKREILARAYLDEVVAHLQMPEPSQVDEYYQTHPELFADRRLFQLEEIAFIADADVADGVRNLLASSRSMKQIADWLRAQKVRFAANQGLRAAEQVALDFLPKMQAMKPGDVSLFEGREGRYQVIRMVAFQPSPVDKKTAAPRIRQYLANRQARKAIAEEMRRLRDQAKIEYVGEFASIGVENAKEPKSQTDTKSKEFTYSWDQEAKPVSTVPSKEQGQ